MSGWSMTWVDGTTEPESPGELKSPGERALTAGPMNGVENGAGSPSLGTTGSFDTGSGAGGQVPGASRGPVWHDTSDCNRGTKGRAQSAACPPIPPIMEFARRVARLRVRALGVRALEISTFGVWALGVWALASRQDRQHHRQLSGLRQPALQQRTEYSA
jgi:hypothetical protein